MPLISIEKGDVLAFHIAACVGNEKNTGTVNYSKLHYTNVSDISGALFILRIQYFCTQTQCEEGGRDVNNVWIPQIMCFLIEQSVR